VNALRALNYSDMLFNASSACSGAKAYENESLSNLKDTVKLFQIVRSISCKISWVTVADIFTTDLKLKARLLIIHVCKIFFFC